MNRGVVVLKGSHRNTLKCITTRILCLLGIDMRKNKIKLRVQPIYSNVIYYVFGLISLVFIFMPTFLSWKSSNLMIEIICCLVLTLFFVYGFVKGTLRIQFA